MLLYGGTGVRQIGQGIPVGVLGVFCGHYGDCWLCMWLCRFAVAETMASQGTAGGICSVCTLLHRRVPEDGGADAVPADTVLQLLGRVVGVVGDGRGAAERLPVRAFRFPVAGCFPEHADRGVPDGGDGFLGVHRGVAVVLPVRVLRGE